jgi:formylglycine-generating enzyme required for sulfatase activity/dienelactone hydrolase
VLPAGTSLGPYKILAPLGAGGMGEVYSAHDSRLGRDVAIKVLPQHLAATPEVRARFEREARTISQLNHPHICTLHDVGHQDGIDYLVMELLEGETLAHRLERGALPVAEVVGLGRRAAVAIALGALGVAACVPGVRGETPQEWARTAAVTEVEQRIAADDFFGMFLVARRALAIDPAEPSIRQAWYDYTGECVINSDPPDAEVAFARYAPGSAEWVPIGRTPLKGARVPMGVLRWRLIKPGYDTLEVAQADDLLEFRLCPKGTSPPGMVLVPHATLEVESSLEEVEIPDFWLDRYEVTNREYQVFVDSGGYRRREFWTVPFLKDGKTLSWKAAMSEFRDATGQPGPSTWKRGHCRAGQEDFPVGGVSWYEAAAYAAFTGKRLPTAYHWYRASGAFGVYSEFITLGNYSARGAVKIGSTGALGPYGTCDLAGNVKEWCWNGATGGPRYILGGGWNEPPWTYRDQDMQSPFERRASFGFRCMRQGTPIEPRFLADVASFERDPASLIPVGQAEFEGYAHLFDYDHVPLEARVDSVDDAHPEWHRERISIRTPYDDERLPIDLFLPKTAKPPFQILLVFPGADAFSNIPSERKLLRRIDSFVRGGRALAYPIYNGTYERRWPSGTTLRDRMLRRSTELRRTLDYLETRPDIDSAKVAFYGLSFGSWLAPIFLAEEPRFRAAILWAGGFETAAMPPEFDPVNYAPRVTLPVLMVNGREDFDFPYATAQVPMFKMLGTPEGKKRHLVFEGGHNMMHPQPADKAMLHWLDEQFGPVR